MKALEMLCADDMDKMSSMTYRSVNAPIMEFIVNRVSGDGTISLNYTTTLIS